MAGSLPQNRGNRSAHRTGATVSRRLRTAGFNLVSPDRRHITQCATVRGAGDYFSVLVDYGLTGKNERVSLDIALTLEGWPQVTDLDLEVLDDGAVYVRGTYTPLSRSK